MIFLLLILRRFSFWIAFDDNGAIKECTLKAVEYAKKNGCIISYDPNYRPMLWENEGLARQWMAKELSMPIF